MTIKTLSNKFISEFNKTTNNNIVERYAYNKCIKKVLRQCNSDNNKEDKPFIQKVIIFRLESLDEDD